MHLDAAEGHAGVVAQDFVVVAGDEHDALAVAGAPQQLLDHRVVGRHPADPAVHRPEVDDVADQVGVLGRVLAQEFDQVIGLAGTGAEMDVGEKE